MKNEFCLFRRDFLQGGLIWLKAEHLVDAIGLGEELISGCEINASNTVKLTMNQFSRLIFLGFFESVRKSMDAILVYGFENATPWEADRFLRAIRYFQNFYIPLGKRMVLVSGEKISMNLRGFGGLSPFTVVVRGRWGIDCMDLRIHRLLEQASSHSKRSVKKLSERAAVFLERVMANESDEDIYSIISMGLTRSDGEVLRFRDLVPNLRPYFQENDECDG